MPHDHRPLLREKGPTPRGCRPTTLGVSGLVWCLRDRSRHDRLAAGQARGTDSQGSFATRSAGGGTSKRHRLPRFAVPLNTTAGAIQDSAANTRAAFS